MTDHDLDMLPDDEGREGRACSTCLHFESCPCGRGCGLCHAHGEMTGAGDACDSWEER